MGGLYHWINFVLLFAILFVVLRKKLTQKFQEEREAMKLEVELSLAKFTEVQDDFEKTKALVANADQTIKRMKQEAADAVLSEIERCRVEHKTMVERMTKDAETRLKAETDRAKQILAQELFGAAARTTEEALKGQKAADEWALSYVQNEAPRSRSHYAT